MIVFRSLAEVPADFGPSIVTIGNFDGLHCGHRTVITEVVARARKKNAKAILVTLDPHPARVLRPEFPLRLITPLDVKLELLADTGLDAVLLLPFTQEFSRTTARTFCETVLRDTLHAAEVHEGENFRFGYGAEADMHSLESLGNGCGFTAHIFAPLTMGRQTVSSSRIRTVIGEGNMSAARHMLGRPFAVDSTPARGRGYGTQYAVPTINLAPYADLLPANGVYVTDLRVGTGASAITFEGATNIGNRPTFGEDSFAVETYLLRFHPIPLDEQTPLRMTFHKRLREEKKWPSPEALKAQIGQDVARAERWFHLRKALARAPGATRSR
ncbi:riboflavin kinase/FMN adenylyltransferase [Terriglobus roseus DSM 18391]|uniref:Riboflavin biosynthesis protein n=1 Tax=Terriglobus roseus (strain DSM 18391 / NRRL B-41598 / KBS 63) TaxID=926566 RepID=I3ZL74_TERRK|nr:riboflavin biosynthesis protein RibF [Terriglobus roseus]AFL89992.1 riboflavin kinase/FMN adenylyltransferase [Terriglobus roseus DSM 18391]